MTDLTQALLLYLAAFVVLWYGSGLVIDSAKILARRLKVAPFVFSFFVLGLLTSIPEVGLGLTAVSQGQSEVFVGNLLGGTIVLFLLTIPLLAVAGGRLAVGKHINGTKLLVILAAISAPAWLILDNTLTNTEAFFLATFYLLLVPVLRERTGFFSQISQLIDRSVAGHQPVSWLRLVAGVILVYFSSQHLVNQTVTWAETYHISVFGISLLVLSLGTNLPEITLAIRSIIKRAHDVALGDYLGSAAANTLLFGVFTFMTNGDVLTVKNFYVPFGFIVGGLATFFLTTRRTGHLGRRAGLLLLVGYGLFVTAELGVLF